MAMDQQQEGVDELLCEIDHWKALHAIATDACRKLVAWDDGEKAGPDYGTLTRDTHPQGEKIWSEWWERQQEICDASFKAARAFLEAKP